MYPLCQKKLSVIPSFTPLIGGAEAASRTSQSLRFNEYSFRVLTRKVAGTKNFERHDNIKLIDW